MTMAPSRKKRGYWIEIIFVGILLFLLMGGRTQRTGFSSSNARNDFSHNWGRGLSTQPVALK